MKFSDWAPIIVALVTLTGVLAVPGLTGNRPRQQLEALKAVRDGIKATDDSEVAAMLLQAERGIASRIENRYSESAVRARRETNGLIVVAVITLTVTLVYPYIPKDDALIWQAARLVSWIALAAAFAIVLGMGVRNFLIFGERLKRRRAMKNSRGDRDSGSST